MWNAVSPGFELVSSCPFPATITITPRLVLYTGHSLGVSYPSEEKQSVYSTASTSWVTSLGTMNLFFSITLPHSHIANSTKELFWDTCFWLVFKLPWCKSNRKFIRNPLEEIRLILSIRSWRTEVSYSWSVGIDDTKDLSRFIRFVTRTNEKKW